MGKRNTYMAGTKWHRGPDGIPRPCTASVRSCKYQDHFETETDARSVRQRQATGIDFTEKVRFSTSLGEAPSETPLRNSMDAERKEISLRESAEKAKALYAQTGHRPQSPLGRIEMNLPTGEKIVLSRETYNRNNPSTPIGVRYLLRYHPNPDTYEEATIELNNKVEYEMLVKQIDEYYADASDQAALRGEDPSKLIPYYQRTIQAIAEVETMSRGADSAYRDFGIDLFSHESPGVIAMNLDYDNSTVHSYDISDSLKGHAIKDKFPNEVALHIKGQIPMVPRGKWTLDRLPEGDWILGASSQRGIVSQKVSTPEEARKLLGGILKAHRCREDSYQEQLHYVQQVMQEVEPAVNSYRMTMEAKVQDQVRKIQEMNELREQYEQDQVKRASRGGGFGSKISGLFG